MKGEPRGLYDLETCRFHDCDALGFEPDLLRHGFAHVDLSTRSDLVSVLDEVRSSGTLARGVRSRIRRSLRGAAFPVGAHILKILVVAPEGLILRTGGPAGLGGDPEAGPNGERPEPAVNVHADQDVAGTPLRQLLRGFAPWIFRHESPHGVNATSPLLLVNLWIPLQQITRPLALMDRGYLDRRRHQLRFELPTDSFLERDDDRRVNDIWTFLHDPEQRWYFTSEMHAGRAYVFQTLSTPHGAFVLPGEDVAADRSRRLEQASAAIRARDAAGLRAAAAFERVSAETTAPLLGAIAAMEALLTEASERAHELPGKGSGDAWIERAERARDRVVRRSIELRAVALLLPRRWPFKNPRALEP